MDTAPVHETSLPPCARAEQQAYDDVLLSQDLQTAILDTVGLHGLGLGLAAICISWRTAVEGWRTVWRVLKRDSLTCIGVDWLDCPNDVALLPEGAVCVADCGAHRLLIFSKDMTAAPRVVGSRGKGAGQFNYPSGVACDGTALYVGDTNNHRVQKLRLADGAHLGTVGLTVTGGCATWLASTGGTAPLNADCMFGRGDGQFNWPTGLCVAADALYVCDENNHRIVVLGTDLAWRYTIGRVGSGDGEFRYPSAVAAHGGELYVTDQGNHRVQARRPRPAASSPARHAPPRLPRQVIAPDRHGRMRFARAFGGKGDTPGQFVRPQGVAVVRGLLVVSEKTRLQVLTPKGVPLQVLTLGSGLRGLCADEERLWVADDGAHRVHVFRHA